MNRVEYIKKRCKGKILDVGYYTDTLHKEVLKDGGKENVYGVDIETVKETDHYKKASAEKIPFESNMFDTLIAGELIEHLGEPRKFILEANRLLKKGGTMVLTTPNRDSLINRIFKNNHMPLHISLFNAKELSNLIDGCGFEVVNISYFPYLLESSPGSRHAWSFLFRHAINPFLPHKLREELVMHVRKKS